ncbi:MAG: vitamin K epoxide reductase family protein [Candidatus Buchananbacteria bacterium]
MKHVNDVTVWRLFVVRENAVEPIGQGITRAQKIEVFGLVLLFVAIISVAIWSRQEAMMAKTLDLLGTVNAAFLALTSYRHELIPNSLKRRHKAIVSTGLTVIWIPCGWLDRKLLRDVVLEIPIAVIGLVGYLIITTLLIASAPASWVLFFAGVGTLVSAKLMQIMFRDIRISCPFCVFSAGTMFVIFLLTLWQV